MSACDMPEYLNEIERLKNKYKAELEIYTGLEIDFLTADYNPSIPYFRQLPLDYRIGSVHFLPLTGEMKENAMFCIDGSYADFEAAVKQNFGGDIKKVVQTYFDSSMKMVESGGFDIVGHLDKIYMNGQRFPGFDLTAGWYRSLITEYLHLIAEKGVIVEINTKNFRAKRELYPHPLYLPLLKQLHIPVTVNSDAHYPDLINDGRAGAFRLLKETGFVSTCELVGGEWKEYGLA